MKCKLPFTVNYSASYRINLLGALETLKEISTTQKKKLPTIFCLIEQSMLGYRLSYYPGIAVSHLAELCNVFLRRVFAAEITGKKLK